MPCTISAYRDELTPAVVAFNARLHAAGVRYQFPAPLDGHARCRESRESFVAVEHASTVRGGYILDHQTFFLQGRPVTLSFYQLPLSEGLADRAYGAIGVQLLADALKRQPWLYVLGIGGMHEPLARMVRRLGWLLQTVPFYVKVLHPFNVARQLSYLRTTTMRRMVMDACGDSGAAWLMARVAQARPRMRSRSRGLRDVRAEAIESFEAWADRVWATSHRAYSLIALRDRATLNRAYPPESGAMRIRVSRQGEAIGWAVLTDTAMRQNRYFGDLRVGSIADCLAPPTEASVVIEAALRHLEARGVDLIVSNQASRAWRGALLGTGFVRGPSQFVFGASKPLARALEPLGTSLDGCHLTRGDGDGPINL